MSRKRRKTGNSGSEESEIEYEQSFTVTDVKENLRSIGQKFSKWVVEGVSMETTNKVQKMASSVRQMRNFLIQKKQLIGSSKSSRQLKQLEALTPLLDSANYLNAVYKDYLNQRKGNVETVKPEEHEEVELHDNSFVDMFLDETPDEAGWDADTGKDNYTDNGSHCHKNPSSKSILKTSFSDTPGNQKKITFAKKATKVYENNETSQISLSKSSGSVKGADALLNSQIATAQKANSDDTTTRAPLDDKDNARQASEDMFDDSESIVDTSFQEIALSPPKPREINHFTANNITQLSGRENAKKQNIRSATNLLTTREEAQISEADPLLSQECLSPSHNAPETREDPQKDATVPFHNFLLTLPQDSSSSENSLDARVNMALNLVNTKPKEPGIKQLTILEKTPHNSTEGIIESTVTCTDFRWMEPVEYARRMSQDNTLEDTPNFNIPMLPASSLEDALQNKNILPPFDINEEDNAKILEAVSLDIHPKEISFHGRQNYPQTSLPSFSGKPNWANPLQSTENSVTGTTKTSAEIQSLGKSDWRNPNSKIRQEKVTPMKREEVLNNDKTGDLEIQSQPIQEKSKTIMNAAHRLKLPSSTKLNRKMQDCVRKQDAQKPIDTFETYDSHKVAKATKYKTRLSFKKALNDAVLTAKTLHSAEKQQNQVSTNIAETTVELPGETSMNLQDNSKIARLRQFGKCWNNPSSMPSQDTKIERTQSKRKKPEGTIPSKSKPSIQKRAKAQMKLSQVELSQAAIDTSSKAHSNSEVDKGENKGEKEASANEQSKLLGRWDNTFQKEIGKSLAFSTSSSLPDRALKEPQCSAWSCTDPNTVSHINTSSMICETSHSEEKLSQGRRKRAKPTQKDERGSKNLRASSRQPQDTFKQRPDVNVVTGSLHAQDGKLETQEVAQKGQDYTTKVSPGSLENCASGLMSKHKTTKPGGPSSKISIGKPTQEKPVKSNSLKSDLTSNSHFEHQFNVDSNNWHQRGLKLTNQLRQSLPNLKMDVQQAQEPLTNSKSDWHQVQSLNLKPDSDNTQTGFLRFQKLQGFKSCLENQSRNSSNQSGNIFQTICNQEEQTHQNSYSYKPVSAQTEIGFGNFQPPNAATHDPALAQHVSVQKGPRDLQPGGYTNVINPTPDCREKNDSSFFKPSPNDISNLFVPNPNTFVVETQSNKNGWQFNFPTNSHVQHTPSEQQQLTTNMNWMNFAPIETSAESINTGIDEKTAESKVSPFAPSLDTKLKHQEEKIPKSPAVKQSVQEGTTLQPKSPKMTKLLENETILHSMGTQGTEVLYEGCDNLSWASDDSLNTQMFNTQTLNTDIFDSQNVLLNQNYNRVYNINSRIGGKQGTPPFQYEAQTQLSWGLTAEFEEATSALQEPQTLSLGTSTNQAYNTRSKTINRRNNNPQPHNQSMKNDSETIQIQPEFKRDQVSSSENIGATEPQENSSDKEPTKTLDEEIDELINSIEWVRRIPESELIEAANIEELINDQTFIW